MSREIIVYISGCDDSQHVALTVTPEGEEAIRRLATLSHKRWGGCTPGLAVEGDEDYFFSEWSDVTREDA